MSGNVIRSEILDKAFGLDRDHESTQLVTAAINEALDGVTLIPCEPLLTGRRLPALKSPQQQLSMQIDGKRRVIEDVSAL